jgi:hypothetical protein
MKPVCFPRDRNPAAFPSMSYLYAMEGIASRCSLRLCQLIALSSEPVAALPLLNALLEHYGGEEAQVNYEMKAFVLEVFGVMHYRCGDIAAAQNALEACLELATGYTPPVDTTSSSVGSQSSSEWNADGRYSAAVVTTAGDASVSIQPAPSPQLPVLGLGMPVASYFLSAVYSSVHSRCGQESKTAKCSS